METTGADLVIKTLREQGVEVIFGYPGANTLSLHDRLVQSPIRHYLTRHEQAAAHAADGYARATGKVGVCLATSGPGATNLVTGIATAFMDSTPLVALTAQVNTGLLGRDAFQETDIMGITLPITKHSFQVSQTKALVPTLRQAFTLAQGGRPGPILVDIPSDILTASVTDTEETETTASAQAKTGAIPEELEKLARILNQSQRPIILIGGGVNLGNASAEMTAFIAKTQIPYVTTLMGIGSVQSQNGLHLGFIGTHGNELANRMVHQSDFILAAGTRFTDRTTTPLMEEFAPLATVAQIDIDPTSIGKNVKVDFPVIGDIGETLRSLIGLVDQRNLAQWRERIAGERELLKEKLPDLGCGEAGRLIRGIQAALPAETVVVTDVGLNQIWTLRTWEARSPRALITSGGMGAMGFAVPAALGAKVGVPEKEVVAITGDGGFYMNIQELATISYYRLPVKIVVINNGHLGMIRQLQDLLYDARFHYNDLGNHVDLQMVARGFGIPGHRIAVGQNPEEGIAQMSRARGPFLLEALVDPNAYVYPIVPPGCSNIEMICGK